MGKSSHVSGHTACHSLSACLMNTWKRPAIVDFASLMVTMKMEIEAELQSIINLLVGISSNKSERGQTGNDECPSDSIGYNAERCQWNSEVLFPL